MDYVAELAKADRAFNAIYAENAQLRADLRRARAEAWEEGFDTGHYLEGEDKSCDCKENPYRG